ncbi:MAG: amidohydrolase family protein, partial [Cyclobacteriaceae bacterium]|nr:amidohydrolase family protein [Cyclobacteriaceae bacterium]
LRAVGLSELKEIFSQRKKMPFHLHISEQEAEVKDCLQFYKSSPVNLLMDQVAVDENVHLVHGTHITKEEMTRIVDSGASIILCPSTEGNLGDGTFSFREFLDMGGTWSIGSDSHVGLNPLEDLRWLDYGQRLLHLKRDTFRKGSRGMGDELYKQSISGGNKAAGLVGKPGFEKGMKLTGLVLNENHPLVFSTGKDLLLNALIYSCDSTVYEEVLVNGNPVIIKNFHENYEEIANNFKKTMKNLGIRL